MKFSWSAYASLSLLGLSACQNGILHHRSYVEICEMDQAHVLHSIKRIKEKAYSIKLVTYQPSRADTPQKVQEYHIQDDKNWESLILHWLEVPVWYKEKIKDGIPFSATLSKEATSIHFFDNKGNAILNLDNYPDGSSEFLYQWDDEYKQPICSLYKDVIKLVEFQVTKKN